MRKTLIAVLLALALVVIPVGSAFAATTADVTVTAKPLYLSITESQLTWTINGIAGSGLINSNTTYYAKGGANETTAPSATVLEAETYFIVICNTGATTCDLTVTWGAFTGGGAAMTNSNDGTNVGTTFGAYCWYAGLSYASKVLVKDTGSDEMYSTGLAATVHLHWGVEILTRATDWTSGVDSISHLIITATAH